MILCILGPTGVGKTKLSEALAIKYDAIVVNADAMQVYKQLNIGTAKITKEEKLAKCHYLFDIKNPDEDYSVYDYQKDARKILDSNKHKNIILFGGTGLYIKAALFNYEFSEITSKNEYENYTNEELYEILKNEGRADDVHVNNRRRLVSKLNSSKNSNGKNELLYDNVIFIGLTTDRDVLYKIIDNRVDKMINRGLLDEVKELYKKYGKVKSLNTAIGYKELIDYFDGNMSLEDAIALIKSRSRKYTKRQYTWFNNQMNITWFNTDYDNFDSTIKLVEEYINEQN